MCQSSIKLFDDWRREKLLEGVQLYGEFIKYCDQNIAKLEKTKVQLEAERGKLIQTLWYYQ